MAPSVWLLFVYGVVSLTAVGALPKPRPSAVREGRSCRCVPDQFEVTLISLEREFDLMGEQLREKQARMLVHYDYTNKIFASTEVESGVRTVADYGKVSLSSYKPAIWLWPKDGFICTTIGVTLYCDGGGVRSPSLFCPFVQIYFMTSQHFFGLKQAQRRDCSLALSWSQLRQHINSCERECKHTLLSAMERQVADEAC